MCASKHECLDTYTLLYSNIFLLLFERISPLLNHKHVDIHCTLTGVLVRQQIYTSRNLDGKSIPY